jgi:hypothetical protein
MAQAAGSSEMEQMRADMAAMKLSTNAQLDKLLREQ